MWRVPTSSVSEYSAIVLVCVYKTLECVVLLKRSWVVLTIIDELGQILKKSQINHKES